MTNHRPPPSPPATGRARTRTWRLALLLTVATTLTLPGSRATAQDLETLRDEYLDESRELDADIADYLSLREEEEAALQHWSELSRRLDRAMSDPGTPPSELVRLHDEIARARQSAVEVSEKAGQRRTEMGARMARMHELLAEANREGVRYVDPNGRVGGTWLVEANAGLGLLSVTENTTGLTGVFRLSNGRHGTLSGRYAGGRFEVELSDSDYGPIGTLVGELDETGRLGGQWTARELAAGEPTGGTWSARQLSFDDLLSLDR